MLSKIGLYYNKYDDGVGFDLYLVVGVTNTELSKRLRTRYIIASDGHKFDSVNPRGGYFTESIKLTDNKLIEILYGLEDKK